MLMEDLLLVFEDTAIHTLKTNEAWVWIPILVAIALITTIVVISTRTEKTTGKKIAVLGMPSSGKTTFLDMIRYGVSHANGGTALTDIPGFTKTVNGREVVFAPCKDIGGGRPYVEQFYKDQIKENDIIFFLFDAYKYLNNTEYQKEVNCRLSFVYDSAKERGNFNIDNNVVIIGSHSDCLPKSERKDSIAMVQSIVANANVSDEEIIRLKIAGKEYAELLKCNFFITNLTNKKEINSILEKLF